MKLSVAVSVLGIAAAVAMSPAAFAFEAVTSDGYPTSTLSTRLADPDQTVQDLSRRYTGNSATIMHFGNTTVGIIGGNGIGYGANSPFVPDPAVGMVPSKRQW